MDLYINYNILVYSPMNKLYHAIIGVEELSDDTDDGDVENEAELSDEE